MSRRRKNTYVAPIVEEIWKLQAKDRNDRISQADARRLGKLQDQRDGEIVDAIPKLTCCDEAKGYHAVRFSVDIYDSDEPPKEGRWYLPESESLARHRQSRDPDWHKKKPPEPKFCPFCGTAVPKMRLKADPPKDLCRVTDGGYYCDTCGERLNGCLCLPAEAAFEPVPNG